VRLGCAAELVGCFGQGDVEATLVGRSPSEQKLHGQRGLSGSRLAVD
jgi:hypothetical protein